MPNSWLTTIDFIKYLALENNVMPVILGEQGNGKTAFTHLLHTELNPHMQTYVVIAGPLFNRDFFLLQLKDLLGVAGEFSLSKFIEGKNEQKSHLLLIIDDAHFLSADFVEELLKELRKQGSTGYFHICLTSDFSLVPVINKLAEDVYHDAIHSIELGALSESETKTYLLQHLAARHHVEKIVTDARVKQFYQLTAGHFMDINRQMMGYFGDIKTSSRSGKLSWPVSVMSIILLTAAVYIWKTNYSQIAPTTLSKQAIPIADAGKTELPSQIEPLFFSAIPSYELAAIRQAVVATPIRRADFIVMDEEEANQPENSMGVVDKVIVAPKIVASKDNQLEQTQTIATVKNKKTSTIQPPVEQNRYTIQLLASHNKKKLRYFVNAHHLKGKVQLRRSLRQGVAWYVLTLGEYAERQHAQDIVNKLPKEIANYKPWVRTITNLKAAG